MSSQLSRLLPANGRAAVMGILNITPDSFSDGGQYFAGDSPLLDNIIIQAEAMVAAGVDIFDVGGESTRPGARPVTTEQELARVIPVVECLKSRYPLPVSVDTSNPAVITAAARAGANMINDVRALTRPGALEAAEATGLPLCLMHMPAEPGEMQLDPRYENVVAEVMDYLRQRVTIAVAAGIDKDNIAIDPGFGFGKTLAHNLALFRALPDFVATGQPVLVGVSRKRMVGEMLNRDNPLERIHGSVALAQLAAQAGARIIRVHDVAATVDALSVLTFVEG